MTTDNRDIQARRTIESMCTTWRHDYGLNKTGSCALSSGMTEDERAVLRNQMAQLHDHHVAPLEDEICRLRQQVESLQAAEQCASAASERIKQVAIAQGFDPDSGDSPLDYLIARTQDAARGAPAYTAEMGEAAHAYIDRCCRSDTTGELLISPPAMPGGFRWYELYSEMLRAAGLEA
jgi:hypothetical protein